MSTTLDLLLIGLGHVGRRFVELADEQRDRLRREHGLSLRLIGIVTGRHGHVITLDGLSRRALRTAVARRAQGRAIGEPFDGSTRAFITAALRRPAIASRARRGRVAVVETTTLDITRGQPAIDHVLAALRGAAHVATANKGPAAFAYRRLARVAAAANRWFLFEGAVMDGVPIFSLVRETLPAVLVLGFRGVVNSTTNFILSEMERGRSFEEALAAMQAAGIAEADPTLDVDGWDAAAKTAALANVLLGAGITPHDVRREGLGHLTTTRVSAAQAAGRRLKLVASAERVDTGVRARVRLVEVPATDLLAGLDREQNALILKTDLLDEIAVVQRGSGLTQTAYALLADVVTIARHPAAGAADRFSRARPRRPARARRGRTP